MPMKLLTYVLVVLLSVAPKITSACGEYVDMVMTDIFNSDAIIVGEIIEYDNGNTGDIGAPSGYARFRFTVHNVIFGSARDQIDENSEIVFTWDNSTFSEPAEMNMDLIYLIALRSATSPMLPLRGTSAAMFPTPEPDLFTVLQAPCSSPYIFDANSLTGEMLKLVFDGTGDPETELSVLQAFAAEADIVIGQLTAQLEQQAQKIEEYERLLDPACSYRRTETGIEPYVCFEF